MKKIFLFSGLMTLFAVTMVSFRLKDDGKLRVKQTCSADGFLGGHCEANCETGFVPVCKSKFFSASCSCNPQRTAADNQINLITLEDVSGSGMQVSQEQINRGRQFAAYLSSLNRVQGQKFADLFEILAQNSKSSSAKQYVEYANQLIAILLELNVEEKSTIQKYLGNMGYDLIFK
jgi:hypothetical protein